MPSLTTEPIDVAQLAALVMRPGHGAIATFTGHVRDHHAGRSVLSLSYSAYPAMAERECEQIIAAAELRWPVSAMLRHRLGELLIGDVAVAVAVGGAHRDEAFAACRFIIEEVKRLVPIWKHEFYADGTSAWTDPTAAAGAAPRADRP